ncbi:MAG: ferrous iron transport protein B [Deltaproteobacteria bacterium]|jgi:ferrous iron transport protein B|nr:ferrous iron transport protein B [Deltaproteobacteria bacterium]
MAEVTSSERLHKDTEKGFIAIAGNPNSGKTTAFNRYTGARQHVGNYPGITVEKKEGVAHLPNGTAVTLVDLPGTYSLTAYSMEEVVARRVLAEERPGAVIDVLNTPVLERNLYLAVQMLEMGIPLVLCLNMMDEARERGVNVNAERLEQLTGLKCVPAVARKGDGLDEALTEAVKLAEKAQGRVDPLIISYGPDLDAVLPEMTKIVSDASLLTDQYPARWVAMKFLEKDRDIISRARRINSGVCDKLAAIAAKVEAHLHTTLNTYPEAVIADYRYGWINSIIKNGVLVGSSESFERVAFSDKLDRVLTNRLGGPLILLAVLYAIYFFTIEVGQYPNDWLSAGFDWLSDYIGSRMADGSLKSLVTAGIIAGVGGVLGFVPLIMIMFFMIAFLEDSGYMARVAYIMDRVFRFFGLHGASIMPFIIGGGIAGGCAVPGVMGARTLRSPKERLATILTVPFMTCGAKIPVFLLFVNIFFESHAATVMFILTLAGWATALLVAMLLRHTIIKGEPTPFVMELPPYRLPTLSGILIHTWERTWQYIKKAGTIILGISILIWAAMTFPDLPQHELDDYDTQRAAITSEAQAKGQSEEEVAGLVSEVDNQQATETLRHSLAGRVGIAIETITEPAGFDWRTNIALLGGIAAKEVVISTLGTAYSLGAAEDEDEEAKSLSDRIKLDPNWKLSNAVALLLFTLLYSPCFVTLAMIKQETGAWKWLWFSLFFNLILAYLVAVAANQFLIAI